MKSLQDISTLPPENLKKEKTVDQTHKHVTAIKEEQQKLFAENKRSVLIILQGMDTSGKDGVIKQVFGSINPQGVSVTSFKAPSGSELSHNFLWRIYQELPRKGMIKIFNRSHYEDILVPSVHGLIAPDHVKARMEVINSFENHLEREGTVILKFFLHISKQEQKVRLEERLTNKLKNWKYSASDFSARKDWDKYMKVYQTIFNVCNEIEWNIIPSDKNWYKEYLISKIVADKLVSLGFLLPQLDEILTRKE